MTTASIKEAAPLIWAEVEQAKSILLHCHLNPDLDSIGSALAMKQVLESVGKKVTLIKGDSDLPKWAKLLPAGETIIEKNYFEVDLNEFDLFIAQDSSDLERISLVGEIIFPPHLRVVNIDHHASNTNFGHVNLVATNKPATAQILFELFREWGVVVSESAANCLMAGINSDTGGFQHRGTNTETFTVAAALATIAPNFSAILKAVYGMSSLPRLRFMGQMMQGVELLFDGQVALAGLSYEEFVKLQANKQELKQTGLSNMLLNIEGVKMAFLLVEDEPGITGISSRSRDGNKYDVAKLLGEFGGGGHQAAAGAHINKPLAEAKADLVAALESIFS